MKTILYLVTYILYPFSFLFIRNKNRIAFGSFRGSFNDNSKYLFLYASNNCLDTDVAWLSDNGSTVAKVRSLGLNAYKVTSLRGAWYALTAKYWFFNAYTSDIMFFLSGGAVCINLWHGVGIKRIEYNITTGPLARMYEKKDFKNMFFHPQVFRKPDYVLSSTPFQTHFFSTSFRVEGKKCLEFGYPRNEVLVCSEVERKTFLQQYGGEKEKYLYQRMKEARRVFVYMPTWRDSQLELFTQGMDLNRLDAALGQRGDLMLLKPHANVHVVAQEYVKFANLIFVEGETDLYPLLPYTDVLITDYSSVLYDYILMEKKGVILYLYDYSQYVSMRDFYYPFDENVIGKRVYDFDSLLKAMDNEDCMLNDSERLPLVEKFWGDTIHQDSRSRLMNFVGDRTINC